MSTELLETCRGYK